MTQLTVSWMLLWNMTYAMTQTVTVFDTRILEIKAKFPLYWGTKNQGAVRRSRKNTSWSGWITNQKIAFFLFLTDATRPQWSQLQIGTPLRQTDKEPRLSNLSYRSRTRSSHLVLWPHNIHSYCTRLSTFTAVYGERMLGRQMNWGKEVTETRFHEAAKKYHKTPRREKLLKWQLVFWRWQVRISAAKLLIVGVIAFLTPSRNLRDSTLN